MKKYLLGALETFLFMPNAHERFSTDKKDAIKSFIIPALVFPLVVLVCVFNSSGEFSPMLLIGVHSIRLVTEVLLTIGFIYAVSGILDTRSGFWRYISMSNWFYIPMVVLITPALFGIASGMDITIFENYFIFLALYSVVMMAFMLTYSLKTNWQLASFMAITCMFISQILLDVAVLVRDSLV